MCAQNGGKKEHLDITFTEQLAAQLERERSARDSDYFRDYVEQYEKVKAEQGEEFKTLVDFFDFCREVIKQTGKNDAELRLATELFLEDHKLEMETLFVHAPEIQPPAPVLEASQPAPEVPPPASELFESEKVWQEWLAEAKNWTPAKEKKFIQEHYPEGLAVRSAKVGWNEKDKKIIADQKSNFDGEACLFFLKKVIGLDEEYLKKTKYVAPGQYVPGALNLDTSWGVWGGAGLLDNRAEAYDHHAPPPSQLPSNASSKQLDAFRKLLRKLRKSSAFELLYHSILEYDHTGDQGSKNYKEGEMYKSRTNKAMTNPEEKIAWENLALFVTAVDSLTLPPGVSWEDIWDNFENNIFAICVTHQWLISSRVGKLFEFFKTHSWTDAFQPFDAREINTILGKAWHDKKEDKPVFLSDLQADIKRQTEDFFNKARGSTLFSPIYGKILVVFNEQVPGSTLAAFGHGYDAVLLWKPEQNSFMLNVKPTKPSIPHALHDKLGKDQSVWLRGGMFFQPDWRSKALGLERLNFSFVDLIKELNIDPATLSVGFKRKIEEAEKCWKK
ncbi:MAG: hypothetical protein HZC26_04365 [Candidatus Magasanikbacteria bacterium]|nr:hypothetical protein [Candidatus Magasanikbacteria bacterium]